MLAIANAIYLATPNSNFYGNMLPDFEAAPRSLARKHNYVTPTTNFRPIQSIYTGYNMNNPIFYSQPGLQHSMHVNPVYSHSGAIGNPYAPITSSNLRKKHLSLNENRIKRRLQKQLTKQYNTYNDDLLKNVGQSSPRNNQKNHFNKKRMLKLKNKGNLAFIPSYSYPQTVFHHNFANSTPNQWKNDKNNSHHPHRLLKQDNKLDKYRKLKLKVNKNPDSVSPEEMTNMMKEQITNMRKLMSSMTEVPKRKLGLNKLTSTREKNKLKSALLKTPLDMNKSINTPNKKRSIFRDF